MKYTIEWFYALISGRLVKPGECLRQVSALR